MSYGHRSNRVVRDGRCTKYLMTGAGRCPNPTASTDAILCERCTIDRKGWGNRLGRKLAKNDHDELLPAPPVVLPAWMSDPSLLPKRPPGR